MRSRCLALSSVDSSGGSSGSSSSSLRVGWRSITCVSGLGGLCLDVGACVGGIQLVCGGVHQVCGGIMGSRNREWGLVGACVCVRSRCSNVVRGDVCMRTVALNSGGRWGGCMCAWLGGGYTCAGLRSRWWARVCMCVHVRMGTCIRMRMRRNRPQAL